MAHTAVVTRRRARRWPGPTLGLALVTLTCGLLAACGATSGAAPDVPTATPSTPGPSPTPTTVGFLHVQQTGGLVTYRIDSASGRLDKVASQSLGDIQQLATDPAGRFVYAAYGSGPAQDPSIVSYTTDEHGTLVPVSEVTSHPLAAWWPGWTWLTASSSRVYALWRTRYGGAGHLVWQAYVSHAVAPTGQLGQAYVQQFLLDDSQIVALDPGADVFYKAAPPSYVDGTDRMGITAHIVSEEGRLAQTGWSDLCLASAAAVTPLVAVRGVVFGRAYLASGPTICSWEGTRLAPRANLGMDAEEAAAFSPPDATSPALLAIATDTRKNGYVYDRTSLRLLSTQDGDVELLDTAELTSPVRQLLFHPSGHFLYLSDEDGRLRTYSVVGASRLQLIEDLPDAGGAPVDSPWYYQYWYSHNRVMAVSVRSGTPRL